MGHEFISNLRRWDIVAGLCQSIDAKSYMEIGAKEGRTIGHVLRECPDVFAIGVDPWCKQEPTADASRETYADWDFAEIERKFWENVGQNKSRCAMLRRTSEQARALQAVGTQIGVVFIDALHDYESVKQDIELWWPLVAPGGYLSGHDYNHKWPGVMRAVAEAFPLFKVGLAPDSVWFVRKESLQ